MIIKGDKMDKTKKKKEAPVGEGGLEKKVDESEGLSMKVPIHEIEKYFSPLTYQNLQESIGNLLVRVRRDYAKSIGADGRFTNPGKIAAEITKGIATEILPYLELNEHTKKYIRNLLKEKGVLYDQIKKTLSKISAKDELSFASTLREQFAKTIQDSYQKDAQEHIHTYMTDEEGRKKMMEHVSGRAEIKWLPDTYIDTEAIINMMSAYMRQPGIFDEKGNVVSGRTKLPDEVLVEVGKGLIQGYDEVYKRHQERLETLHPADGKPKKDKKYEAGASPPA